MKASLGDVFVDEFRLIALELAIACYVASEIGVSNWLIRFLEDVPLATATTSLSLFWGGLALGRLVQITFGRRFAAEVAVESEQDRPLRFAEEIA